MRTPDQTPTFCWKTEPTARSNRGNRRVLERVTHWASGWLYFWIARIPGLNKLVFGVMGRWKAWRQGYPWPAPKRCVVAFGESLRALPNSDFELIRGSHATTPSEHLVGDGDVACPALGEDKLQFPAIYRMSPRGATVLANGVVLTAENQVLREVCPDFLGGATWHRLCAAGRIPEPKPLNGELAVLSSLAFSGNYYHWVFDTLARWPLLPQTFSGRLLIEHARPYQRQYLEIVGVEPCRCIEPMEAAHWRPDRLVIPSLPGVSGIVPPESVTFLRKLRDQALSGTPREKGRRVYLQRETKGARGIRNADEVTEFLVKRGFTPVCCGTLSVVDQMRLLRDADVVVAPHGAALTNLAYCQPGATVIELHCRDSVNWCYRRLCAVAGLRYGCLLCPPPRHALLQPPFDRSLLVPIDRLARLLSCAGIT